MEKTIEVLVFNDRIELKGKGTNNTYEILPYSNIEKNTKACMCVLMFKLSDYQSKGYNLEFQFKD